MITDLMFRDTHTDACCMLQLHPDLVYLPADLPVRPDYMLQIDLPGLAWQLREQTRIESGHYETLPAKIIAKLRTHGVELTAGHYVHIAKQDNDERNKIAYTENADKGELDRQTSVKFGRYLKRFHPTLSDQTIQAIVRELQGALGVQEKKSAFTIANTRDELNRIFETEMSAEDSGYTSCMYGKFADWPIRPYWVYAGSPDVAVAVLRDDNGRIVARSVVNEIDKKWVRLYALKSSEWYGIMRTYLENAGYTQGDLKGCKLTLLRDGGRLIAPYVDGCASANIDGQWLVIQRHGDIELTNTDGYAENEEENERAICTACGGRVDDDETQSFDGDTYCQSCFDDRFSYCESCEEYCSADDMDSVYNKRGNEIYVCTYCRRNNYTEVKVSDSRYMQWHHNDNVIRACDGNDYFHEHSELVSTCDCCSETHVDGCDCACQNVEVEA